MRKFKYRTLLIVIFWSILLNILADVLLSGKVQHPYLGYDFSQYLTNLSYQIEHHTATTSDGYILALYRIPCKRYEKNCSTQNKTPVLMVHGLLSSALEWILQGPDTALGLRLADAGIRPQYQVHIKNKDPQLFPEMRKYTFWNQDHQLLDDSPSFPGYDIWLTNNRGVLTSRNHTKLDPIRDVTFWDFSYHDLGVYDLPALIDYILEFTNRSQLHYVGNSQGVTQFLVMGSERPQYNQKIKLATLLAPATGIGNHTGLHITLTRMIYYTLEAFLSPFDIPSLSGSHCLITQLMKSLVFSNQVVFDAFLKIALLLQGGGSFEHTNVENFTYILQYAPTEVSLKQLKHFIQTGVGDNFRHFDYGKKENLLRYNQIKPPKYDVSKISVPTGIFYSKIDQYMGKHATESLMQQLPMVVEKYEVNDENFYHQDLVLGRNLSELVLDRVFNFMTKFDAS